MSVNGTIQTFAYGGLNSNTKHDLELSLLSALPAVVQTLHQQHNSQIKYQLILHAMFAKTDYDDSQSTKYIDGYFLTESTIYDPTHIVQDIERLHREIIAKFDVFVQQGSGLTLHEILAYKLRTYKFIPLRGGAATNTKSNLLPVHIRNKKACMRMLGCGDLCFVFSCLASMHPSSTTHPARSVQYEKYLNSLNLAGLEFPLPLSSVRRFEMQNTSISVNVLGLEGKHCVPLYRTRNTSTTVKHKVNLLLYKNHYYLVRSMSRLLYDSTRQRHGKLHFCHSCLCSYSSKKKLRQHSYLCLQKQQRLHVPKKRKKIEFQNYRHMFKKHFVIYYDIESLLTKEQGKHVPVSVCAFTKCSSNDEYSKGPFVFTGQDCIQQFLAHLLKEEERIMDILQHINHPLKVSDHDEIRIREARYCEVCRVRFTLYNPKYRDHNHLDNKSESNLRYVACNRCNLTYGQQNKCTIPVIAHNANKYDMHFIIQHLPGQKTKLLARNSETLIAARYGQRLQFIDSINFMNGSLDSLVQLLPTNDVDRYTSTIIGTREDLQWLLRRKGVFPYDYLDDYDKLYQREMPRIEHFYNSLRNEPLSEDDYRHFVEVWNSFECETMQDYMELYLITDTMLLAAVVERYRQSTLEHFQLDPMHYVTAPSLCFDAMLKITGVQLDLLPSVDQYLFFSRAIRGGICGTATRYAKANNDSCGSPVDDTKPQSHILSFDCNNLYGLALSMPLPTSNFRWMTTEELEDFDPMAVTDDGKRGYFLEVDLQYPTELHDLHNELPLAPEKISVPRQEWSKETLRLAEELGMTHKETGLKLMSTLYDKYRYRLHYKTLKLYLRLGLKMTKLHRGITFKQQPFMKEYIKMNTEARKKARSDFEVSLYKGYNNYIFGKTCYNVFKQRNFQLISDKEKLMKIVGKPTFSAAVEINEALALIEMKPWSINCNTAVYIGASVLDLSKHHMYSFYYDYLSPMYYQRHNLKMLYTDTDSFYVQVFNRPDIYSDMKCFEEYFDCSGYPTDHFLFNEQRKRQIGKMKDIHGNGCITDFVALRSKMYSVRVQSWYADESENELAKAKGIPSTVMKKLNYQLYLETLRHNIVQRHWYKQIRSRKHQVATIDSRKVGLCAYDDKRLLQSCGIHTLAYGHYKSDQQQCDCMLL